MTTAIETEYAGHRFRSRLEARWAVFFDKLGIRWHYEEQGYELPSGRYLPDFRLEKVSVGRAHDLWCEVKGGRDRTTAGRLARAAMELPRQENIAALPSPQILILGEIPRPGEAWTHIRIDVMSDPTWLALQSVHFAWWPQTEEPHWVTRPNGWPIYNTIEDMVENGEWWADLLLEPAFDPHLRIDLAVDAAYRAARSARFEFGQSGAPL